MRAATTPRLDLLGIDGERRHENVRWRLSGFDNTGECGIYVVSYHAQRSLRDPSGDNPRSIRSMGSPFGVDIKHTLAKKD
jgi:hypothetical protein